MRMEMNKTERRSKVEDDKLQTVDLNGLSLDFLSLPNTSLNLTTVRKLDISNNNLTSIPESLTARLINLVVLDVHSNQLKSLPNSIGCLSKLLTLNVSGNLIASLPKTIENCRALEELNANFNQLTKLPDTIGFELTNLKRLCVNSNKIAYLPYSTSHITSLRALDARLNCLRSLPEGLENLVNLEVLNVSQNFQYLETLPYSLGLMLNLHELDISYNNITVLPDSIGCLKKLQKLHLQGNPLVTPPAEVVEQGLDVVKQYLGERLNGNGKKWGKKGGWLGKLVKCGTFNGPIKTGIRESRLGFSHTDYRSIDGLTSPRYMGMFSPRRLFSPKRYSFFSPSR